ncbi:hypothetical protein [Arenimonas soli]|uniref:hypothetical protein n=1 Tax=Arenimonas soli TaxID=2269504 RepID=UPI001669F583|nr:hypothetical protein [Arenimonas soli]
MAPSNREVFDIVATQVFAQLLAQFPMPCDIDADSFAGPIIQNGGDIATADHGRIHRCARTTITFLQGAGLLEVGRVDNSLIRNSSKFLDVRLTMESLTLLRAIPASLSESLGEQLSSAAKQGASSAATSVVQSVFERAIEMGIRTTFNAFSNGG